MCIRRFKSASRAKTRRGGSVEGRDSQGAVECPRKHKTGRTRSLRSGVNLGSPRSAVGFLEEQQNTGEYIFMGFISFTMLAISFVWSRERYLLRNCGDMKKGDKKEENLYSLGINIYATRGNKRERKRV